MTDKQTKALYIARKLMQEGFTLAGASGCIANIEAESAFKSTNLQDSYERVVGMNDEQYTNAVDSGYYTNFANDDCGYGLCQWTAHDRKKNMLAFHRERGMSIGDFSTQVAWMAQEMKSYLKAYNICRESDDAYTCGWAVCKFYEIPANTNAQAEYRGGLAQEWYAWLKDNLEPVPEPEPTPAPTPVPTPQADVVLLQTAMMIDGAWDNPIDGLSTAEWYEAFKEYVKAVFGIKL